MPEGKSSGSVSPATGLFQMDVDSPRYQREAQITFPSPSTQQQLVAKHDSRFIEQELIPESSRLSRLPTEVPSSNSFQSNPTGIAIPAHQNTTHNTHSGHDVHFSVNNPASLPSSSASRNFGQPSTPSETSVSSFSQPLTQHVINHPIRRPRTSTKVFESTTDLAVHYGIPQILPPVPQTTSRYNHNSSNQQARPLSFTELRSNYLNMLKTPTTEPTMSTYGTTLSPAQTPELGALASFDAPTEPPVSLTESELQTIVDIIGKPPASRLLSASYDVASASTPQLKDSDYFEQQNWDSTSPLIPDLDYNTEYGVSPNETPLDDFLDTPAWADHAMLTSPGMDFYYNDFDANQPLIMSGAEVPNQDEIVIKTQAPIGGFDGLSKAHQQQMPNLDSLISFSPQVQLPDTFPSFHPPPSVAYSDSQSLGQNTVASNDAALGATAAPSHTTARPKATGHRQGITPENLLSEDAPTQPRTYVTPSATSKKLVPATFARKRARSMVDDEDPEELPPDATEEQQIAAKRRQNTVAARRSRRRKLEQHLNLLNSRNEEREFKERWERRAKDLLSVLREKGYSIPDFPPDEPQYADAS